MLPPAHELRRTVAAQRVAMHARASDLFFGHFEHHLHLEGPDEWRPPDRPDLAAPSGWRAGVLREGKFQHFRLDRMVGSFHPSHGPKWSAHELCHRLVGWAWRPGASPLWIATAARLAELAPVALWYFDDEIGARRCPRHALCDPRFDLRCAACEALAADGPLPAAPGSREEAEAERLRADGERFVADELEAIARTLREGAPVAHRWTTLELCSDGLAWAAAHGRRLASPTFSAWVERFVPDGTGRHATLDALEARVRDVLAAIRDDAPLTPWAGDRRRWIAQDLGWRMAVVQADCDDDTARAIDAILDALATSLDPAPAVAAWRALAEDVEIPDAEDVFAVGYDLGVDGLGRSARQVRAGLESATPGALQLLGERAEAVVAAFTAADPPERAPLGLRFARFLRDAAPAEDPDVVELAALEAATTHAPPMDPAVATLRDAADPGGPVRLAPGVAVLRARRDWRGALGRPRRKGRPLERPPLQDVLVAVVREPGGDVSVYDLDPALAAVGAEPIEPEVDPEDRARLLAAGVWAPARWS